MGKYVYHYHASRMVSPGRMAQFDGFLVRQRPVTESLDEYRDIKRAIDDPEDGLTIQSLTLISEPSQDDLRSELATAREALETIRQIASDYYVYELACQALARHQKEPTK